MNSIVIPIRFIINETINAKFNNYSLLHESFVLLKETMIQIKIDPS